jgi:site-specific recombinase XerD
LPPPTKRVSRQKGNDLIPLSRDEGTTPLFARLKRFQDARKFASVAFVLSRIPTDPVVNDESMPVASLVLPRSNSKFVPCSLNFTVPAPVEDTMPISEGPVAVYVASLAGGSQSTMAYALESIASLVSGGKADARTFPWHTLRHQHTAAIRSKLAERYSASTANKMLSALRGVLKAAWQLGQIEVDDYHRTVDIPAVKGTTLPRGRALEPGELRALFKTCRDETKAGRRDAALIAVLYGAGLRRSEAAALGIEHFNQETGELRITGKGNRQRLVYATNGSLNALKAWLGVRGTHPGALFPAINKAGRIIPGKITSQAISSMLVKRAEEAGLEHFSPRDLRRSSLGDMLDAGADVRSSIRRATPT